MGSKYMVTAGDGHRVSHFYYTDYLVMALWDLWKIRLDNQNKLVWKQLKVLS